MSLVSPQDTEFGPTESVTSALTLEPRSFSRNRYLESYRDPSLRRCHGRARWLRGLANDVRQAIEEDDWNVSLVPGNTWTLVTYEGRPMSVRRTVHLTHLEMALVNALLRDMCEELPDERFELTQQMQRIIVSSLEISLLHGRRLDDPICVEVLQNRIKSFDVDPHEQEAV